MARLIFHIILHLQVSCLFHSPLGLNAGMWSCLEKWNLHASLIYLLQTWANVFSHAIFQDFFFHLPVLLMQFQRNSKTLKLSKVINRISLEP